MRKRSLMIAVAVAAVLAGAVVAATSGGGGNGHGTGHRPAVSDAAGVGELTVAASYLGVPRTTLRKDLRSGQTLAQIASSTSGKSTAGLIDALVKSQAKQLDAATSTGAAKTPSSTTSKKKLASLLQRTKARVNRVRGYVGLTAIARYLGIGAAKLHVELESGHSAAQIADTIPGKSASGLIAARVKTREAVVKAALKSGRISQSTEKALLSTLRQRVQAEVDRAPGR
jgi:urease accessory protein UreF